jgi:hypothetical protein
MLDLLDPFVEANRLAGFTCFFTHSDTKEVRFREVMRPLVALDLFVEGTNTGVKRVVTANQRTRTAGPSWCPSGNSPLESRSLGV